MTDEPTDVVVLGPVGVVEGPGAVRYPSSGLTRSVLAALAIADAPGLSTDAFFELVWGSRSAASADSTVPVAVHRLRQWLRGTDNGVTVRRTATGYALTGGSDARRFRQLLARSRSLESGARAGLLEEALELWRGPALANVPADCVDQSAVAALDLERLTASVDYGRACLDTGHLARVERLLAPLVELYPLDERLLGVWMELLAATGRQAAALTAYQQARLRLSDELGVDPGPELSGALLRILQQDPAPALSVSKPAQLPADVSAFVGRDAQLAKLDALLTGKEQAVVIAAIAGGGGVGKTALAVHWAHRVSGDFPDGQLYVNLHGHSTTPPVGPIDALTKFLRALGVRPDDIVGELDEVSAQYRSELAGRRMLVVLDNAGSADQVRPLLPGVPTSLVVVTSRDRLDGLIALDGAQLLGLDVLGPEDAIGLLRQLLGAARVDAEPGAAASLVEACARLPLALRIAGAHLNNRPHQPIADYVLGLNAGDRVAALALDGDESATVRATFDLSYRHLADSDRRLFRLLGTIPTLDTTAAAAAALAMTDLPRAEHALDRLTRAQLLTEHAPGRYSCHDLLRAYARARSLAEDPDDVREQALTSLFDYYRYAAAGAMRVAGLVPPHLEGRMPAIPSPSPPIAEFADAGAAAAWLEAELVNLLTVAAEESGHASDLSCILARYLDGQARYAEGLILHRHALRSTDEPGRRAQALDDLGSICWRLGRYDEALDNTGQALALLRETGDRSGEAGALSQLGGIYWRLGRHDEALAHTELSLAIRRAESDRPGQGISLGNLGAIYERLGHYDRAVEHYQQALVISREIGDQVGEARALDNLGIVYGRLGRYDQALDHQRRALAIRQGIRNRAGEGDNLTNLGVIHERLGRHGEALDLHQRALVLHREHGDRAGEANTLTSLGAVYLRLGHGDQATRYHQRALTIGREIGEQAIQIVALNGLGVTALAAGESLQAVEHHLAAHALALATGNRYEQARASDGLAQAHTSLGQPELAGAHHRQALALYTELGVPEAEELNARGG